MAITAQTCGPTHTLSSFRAAPDRPATVRARSGVGAEIVVEGEGCSRVGQLSARNSFVAAAAQEPS